MRRLLADEAGWAGELHRCQALREMRAQLVQQHNRRRGGGSRPIGCHVGHRVAGRAGRSDARDGIEIYRDGIEIYRDGRSVLVDWRGLFRPCTT